MYKTITPIFSLTLAFAIYFFFTSDKVEEISVIKQETEQIQQATNDVRRFNAELESLLAMKSSFSTAELERIEQLVPTKLDDVRILVDLSALAKKHNMLLGNVTVDKEKTPSQPMESESESQGPRKYVRAEDFVVADISFGLIGTYEQFRAFLEDVEKSLTMFEVTNIEFAANEGQLQQYDVTVRIFAIKPSV